MYVVAFTVTTDISAVASASATTDLQSPVSPHHQCYNHDEIDRFMAAVQTVENFAMSCKTSGFGVSINRRYVSELVHICLKYATAAVEQLTKNVVQYSAPGNGSDLFSSDVIEESKKLLMSIVEHAAMLRDCVQHATASQVKYQSCTTWIIVQFYSLKPSASVKLEGAQRVHLSAK